MTPDPEPAARARPRLRLAFGLDALVASVVALVAFDVTFLVRTDYDYWWHLAVGRYLAQQHRLPIHDPFSFTAAGQRWTVHEWLPELAMYELHRAFGAAGARALFALAFATTALVLVAAMRRVGVARLAALLIAITTVTACLPFVGSRPQVLSFLLFVALFAWLQRWSRRPDRSAWALPAVFLLWANVHAAFVIGFALVALFLAAELGAPLLGWRAGGSLAPRWRLHLAAALAVSIVATIVNPNGFELLRYPVTSITFAGSKVIQEWQPTDLTLAPSWPFALLVFGYVALLAVRRPRLALFDLAASLAFALAGLWATRYVPFASLALAMLWARAIAAPGDPVVAVPRRLGWLRALGASSPAAPTRAQSVANLAVVVVIAVALGARAVHTPPSEPVPVAAVRSLAAAAPSGPLFNDYNWGGYVIWTEWPRLHVFIDGRQHDLYTQTSVYRDYVDVIRLAVAPEGVLDRYRIREVLIPPDTPLELYLVASGRWREVYRDDVAVRLERTGG